MSQSVITSAFEQLKAQEAANGGVVILDEFVFANVPDLNITDPIDRGEGMPDAALVVHRQAVGKTGMVNGNAVVYSVNMGADVGDFEFNWVGLVNKASGVVAMIVHAPSQKKIKTAAGQQGNVLTRSFLMEYDGASEQTQIIVPADTWQIDFTARLNGVDERARIENRDIYGAASFFGDGFSVSKNGTQYSVARGVGYVAGLRAELLFNQALTVSQLPAKVWADVSWKGTLTSVWGASVKLTVADSLADYVAGDEQHYVAAVAEITADGTVKDLRRTDDGQNVGLVAEINKKQPLAWSSKKLAAAVTKVSQVLDATRVSIWEYADRITDKPDESDPATWDWSPAFSAAAADNVGAELVDGETYTLRSPVYYSYSTDSYAAYSRLPRCSDGVAVIDYSSLGNAGAGFNAALEVDDAAQPPYVAAFTVKGLSGVVTLHKFKGMVFKGNKNTAAVRLIGTCGVSVEGCTFASNRYGVVLHNGPAPGVFTEGFIPEKCRWRESCLTALAYENGGGDTSFHGSGLGESCLVTTPAGYSPVLIGVNCQPYNAPMSPNIWMGGVTKPVIRNKGLTAHFYGKIKFEGTYKTVIAAGNTVMMYGDISSWSPVDKGTMKQASSGGPTGPAGGNLNFSGMLNPVVTRFDVKNAGTQVTFMEFNEEATVKIVGATYNATFKVQTARHNNNAPTISPLVIVNGNVNPMTKFSITRISQGLRLTTIEDNTVILVMKQPGMPDQASGVNFNAADYWTSL